MRIKIVVFAVCFSGFLGFVSFAYWLTQDEPLNPEIQKILDDHQVSLQQESDTFYYWLGLYAPEGEDPIAFGKRRYELYKDAFGDVLEDYNKSSAGIVAKDIPMDEWFDGVDDFDSSVLCSIVEEVCVEKLDANKEILLPLIEKYRILIQRFAYGLSLPYEGNKFALTLESPVSVVNVEIFDPSLRKGAPLDSLNLFRLYTIDIFYNLKEYDIDNIYKTHDLLLNYLANADTLLDRIIVQALVNMSFDLIVYVYNKNANGNTLNRLTKNQISYGRALTLELGYSYNGMTSIENNFKWGQLLRPFYFHKNRNVNAYYRCINNAFFQELEVSPKLFREGYLDYDFSDESASNNCGFTVKKWTLRNSVGSILFEAGIPKFRGYVKPVYILDARIKLFNIRQQFAFDEEVTQQKVDALGGSYDISNPFYPDTKTAYVNQETEELCFTFDPDEPEEEPCVSFARVLN